MSLILHHCSNPDCHRPYTPDNYAEIITLRQLPDGETNYFVISICLRCLGSINDIIVTKALWDAVQYEIKQNNDSIVLTRQQKHEYRLKHEHYKLLGWGRNREELDDKLKR